jgi:hypothetical protein
MLNSTWPKYVNNKCINLDAGRECSYIMFKNQMSNINAKYKIVTQLSNDDPSAVNC